MHITRTLQRNDASFTYLDLGDVLDVNGAACDLSPLGEGEVLPRGAVSDAATGEVVPWLASDVTRTSGILAFSVIDPQGLGLPTEGRAVTIDWTKKQTAIGRARAAMVQAKEEFAAACVERGVLSEEEADAWLSTGTLPAFAVAAAASLPTEAARRRARFKMKTASLIQRTSPLIAALRQAKGLTDAQVDALFTP